MKLFRFLLAPAVFLLLTSCGSSGSKQDTATTEAKNADSAQAKVETPSQPAESNSKIRNGIELKKNGLDVEQAFLLFEDGTLVPADNKVSVGQKVVMRLIMSGWKEENGMVFPGASEKITTSEGNVVLNEPDLFAGNADGVSAADAKYISLSAEISQLDKLYDHFLVSFTVWDKKSNAEVNGSYKLYLK
jgi:hypothetical protein